MQIQFNRGGTYEGTMSGMAGSGAVSGTYSTEGNVLVMGAPTVSGPGGASTPGGGTMRLKMEPSGPKVIRLTGGQQEFVMTRLGP